MNPEPLSSFILRSIFQIFQKTDSCTGKSLTEALILHQLTHNTMTDCSLNYKFNT